MRKEILIVVVLTLLAAGLRLFALDRWPPGLYHDEAFNGLDALRVLQGDRPIFFQANNGREPLFIYLVALSIALWGRSPEAIRMVSACLGTLTVPATYLMARELFGRRVGLLTAVLMAITFWPLNLSRIGFRAVAMPLFTALAIWSFWRGLKYGTGHSFFAAGFFCGLGFYTYLAARFTIIAWMVFIGYLIVVKKRHLWPQFGLFAATALIVAMPLLWYGITHRAVFLQRAGQISIFDKTINRGDPWGLLLRQGIRSVLMFVWRGDFIPRHNMPYRPVFDPLIAPFFAIGSWLLLGRMRQGEAHFFTLAWLAILLLPTILAEGAPHFLRAVGVLPAACMVPALGLDAAYRFFAKKASFSTARGALSLLLVASSLWTCWDYFGRHVRSEATYYNFESGAVELAAHVNSFLGRGWVGQKLKDKGNRANPRAYCYFERRLWDGWAALRYLIPEDDQLSLWDRDLTPPEDKISCSETSVGEILVVCWPYADYRPALAALLPENAVIFAEEGSRERGDLEAEAKLLYITFTGSCDAEVPRNIMQHFEKGITLLGYSYKFISPAEMRLRLYWQASNPVSESYTVFVHARHGDQMIDQDDGLPAWGYYPTNYWRPGDIVVDEHTIALSEPYPQGQDEVWAGLYLLETGQRLRTLDDRGDPLEDHIVIKIS